MKNKKYYIGLDVHKEKTTYVVLDRIGNILLEGETATLYSELFERLKTYLNSSMIGLEACTSYYKIFWKTITALRLLIRYSYGNLSQKTTNLMQNAYLKCSD